MAVKRLLVLDDQPEFGLFAKRAAERLAFEVTVLDQPANFAATYEQFQPDVILLDIVMPRIDGIEIIQWLIQVENKAKVVICTGYNPQYALAAETLAKATGHFPVLSLSKPVAIKDLDAALSLDAPG